MNRFLQAIEYGKSRSLSNEIWSKIEKCQPIVFCDTAIDNVSPIDPHDNKNVGDAPFPFFSIEVLGQSYIANLHDPKNGIVKRTELACMFVFEEAPKQFEFYHYSFSPDDKQLSFGKLSPLFGNQILEQFLGRLYSYKTGVENTRHFVKIGSGQNKRGMRIRRIVHVMPKKYVDREKDGELRHIDFSHRFNVRGHWRKIQSALGKDRSGDYTVHGFTWVVDYEKGPEHLPLIKKTRLVEEAHP